MRTYSYLLCDSAINLLCAKLRAKERWVRRGGLWKKTNEKPKGKVMNFTVNSKRRAPDLGYLYTPSAPSSSSPSFVSTSGKNESM